MKRQRSRGENTIGGKNANEQKMVGVGGLEPPTSQSRTARSTKLSHTPISYVDATQYASKPSNCQGFRRRNRL